MIALGPVVFVADYRGALYHEGTRTLVVADLHFEKGSSYAARGVFLPPYDTASTLARLALVVARFAPARVVALGDSFHDRRAATRIDARDVAVLAALQRGRDWVWIAGNHDPEPPLGVGGEAHEALDLCGVTLRHLPGGDDGAEIAGHLHPVARVLGRSGSVRRRCFVSDGTRCVMPAFGTFTGGLNMRDVAFAGLFGAASLVAHALGRDRVYAVPGHRCLAD